MHRLATVHARDLTALPLDPLVGLRWPTSKGMGRERRGRRGDTKRGKGTRPHPSRYAGACARALNAQNCPQSYKKLPQFSNADLIRRFFRVTSSCPCTASPTLLPMTVAADVVVVLVGVSHSLLCKKRSQMRLSSEVPSGSRHLSLFAKITLVQ